MNPGARGPGWPEGSIPFPPVSNPRAALCFQPDVSTPGSAPNGGKSPLASPSEGPY